MFNAIAQVESAMTTYRGRMVSGGHLQIPLDVHEELGLADGDDVCLEVVGGELRVRTSTSALARVRAMVRTRVPADVSRSDALIADRRDDAARG